jgi:chaperonin cofactor prefoldin
MKRKELDFSNINYADFKEQFAKAIKGTIQEIDAAKAAQVAKLTQDKAKLELQIAGLKKKSSDIQTQIDKLEGKV